MKLGVVGNGMIVKRLLEDIRALPQVTAEAICVREKSVEKGRELAQIYGIPRIDTDYQEFLQSREFDTVYIGIVNTEHFSYIKKALEAGKHVICEKPFTVHASQARLVAKTAMEKRLFLWEAFKIPYSPVFEEVKRRLPELGEIKLIQCNYSRVSSRYEQYRKNTVLPAFDPDCAGGCLYDINLYNLHFVTGLFGRPAAVHSYANLGYNGIDTSGTVVLEYDGFLAVCTGAKDSTSPSFGLIQGTDGCIRVEGPVSSSPCAELLTPDGAVRVAEDPEHGRLTPEIREFARQYRERDLESCYRMLSHSLMMMEVLEEAKRDAKITAFP